VRLAQNPLNPLEDSEVAPVVVLVSEPAQLVKGQEFDPLLRRDDKRPARRWSVFLVGIAIYNAVLGALVLARSVLRSREAERSRSKGIKSILTGHGD
jgi:hypothetical protein